jgi:cytochrome bd ubiquinol oxidase subunit I
MDVATLSREQFALTIMFHYLFPPLTIGLALVIAYLLGMRLATGQEIYRSAAQFWTGLFAINFAMGVATGVVMEFQFGTNWGVFSRYTGDVFGAAVSAEGLFAFFLESGFLAVLLFGWRRVSPRFHFLAAVMVLVGSVFSAVWITIANSWMQTPAGSAIRDHVVGTRTMPRAEVVDFWAVVFNPSSMTRLAHVLGGAFVLGAFFVLSISAYYLLRGRHEDAARRSFSGALALALVFSLLQVVSGDRSARQVAHTQPAKLAALEGVFTSEPGGTRLCLIGWPDESEQTVHGVCVPRLLSWLAYGDSERPVPGLDQLGPTWGRPNATITFAAFHGMVGIGFALLALALYASFLRVRKRLFGKRWLLWVFVLAIVPAYAANELGWVVTEAGRQPWAVYPMIVDGRPVGGLRTVHAVSEGLTPGAVVGSIIVYATVYATLFALFVWLSWRWIHSGPPAEEDRP